jgi:hypothetical protein
MLSRRIVQSRTSNLDLDAPGCLGNIDRLDTHLTVDNVRFAPCAYMVAQDINVGTGAWASRHDVTKTLSVAGSGAAPTYGNASAIENLSAIYTVSNKYHTAANTTWAQLSDKDFAIEIVYVHDPYLENLPFKTWNGTRGYALYNNGANQTTFYFNDGSSSVQSLVNVVPVTGAIYHLLILGDRSENLYGYLNGVFSDTRALTGVSGNLSTGSGVLLIGNGSSQIISFGVWDLTTNPFPGALKNRTYFDKMARERFAIVAGIQDRRQGAHTFTRATSAYLDKYLSRTSTTRFLHRVSAGWPRVCERIDANGLRRPMYLAEPQITNLATNSEDLATTWTSENLTTISANGAVAPNTETTADGIVANATDTTHGIYGAYTLPATNHCLSLFAKVGNQPRIELYSSIANVSAYFNLLSGTVGTTGAAVTAAGIDPNTYFGYYRCWICFTGSADAKNYGVRAAAADADNTFAGDTATVNTWVWGIQIEATAELFPSSYIPTAAAAVARNKDELSYNVRLPIVGNINDLPQVLNIGGSDYQPCAYLVADDVNVSTGAWASRHNVTKALAYAGAGTNPTPQWDAVSRANKSIKYWASNYHTAADTTWGQLGANDFAVELIGTVGSLASRMFVSTYNSTATAGGFYIYWNANLTFGVNYGGTEYALNSGTVSAGQLFHLMICSDYSDGYYAYLNGVYVNKKVLPGSGAIENIGALSIGAHPSGSNYADHLVAECAIWDLTANPWPGAATNQAVMGAIARARFNQLFRYQSCRLDCEVLHPNVDKQGLGIPLSCGRNDSTDIQYFRMPNTDNVTNTGVANGSAVWAMSGSSDICNGVSNKLSTVARENKAALLVNNVSEATDASCEVPSGQNKIWVGQWYDGTYQPTCLVGGVKMFRSDK